ncbi:MAG: DUF4124 domain-containing protein [Woeseiaceae bacterium]|jgi:hypothetical protein
MRKMTFIIVLLLLAPFAYAQKDATKGYFKWVDEDGVVHYGDSIPAKYRDLPKEVVNDYGVQIDYLEGKKSPEQLEAERLEEQRVQKIELQRRADQALLATYLSVDEILLHRDRRVELFQAQARVTELYLRNLDRRLESLRADASNFQPYSENPDAPMIAEDLAKELRKTKEIINRHERNLKKFKSDEQQIIARFEGDINRFKTLRGIN